jgi:hypothetical protein
MARRPRLKTISDLTALVARPPLPRQSRDVVLPDEIRIERQQLLMSLARTLTMQSASAGLTMKEREAFAMVLARSTAVQIGLCMDRDASEFAFTNRLNILIDSERTTLAGRVGGLVADLMMRELEVAPGRRRGPSSGRIPDFVYDPGARHGFAERSVVVTEAKGSLSPVKAKRTPILALARNAYDGQVRRFVGRRAGELTVACGYAVAFGAVPDSETSRLAIASSLPFVMSTQSVQQAAPVSAASTGFFLQQQGVQAKQAEELTKQEFGAQMRDLVRQERQRGGGRGGGRDGESRRGDESGQPSGRIAFANYESVFLMCGAINAAAFLRSILSGARSEDIPADAAIERFWVPHGFDNVISGHNGGFFVDNEYYQIGVLARQAEQVLRAAANNTATPPPTIAIDVVPPIESRAVFDLTGVALQGDGLALFGPTSLRSRDWDLRAGAWID